MLIRILLNLFTRLSYEIDKITKPERLDPVYERAFLSCSPRIGSPHSIYTMHRYALVATTTYDNIITNNRHISRGERIAAIFYIRLLHRNKLRITNFELKNYNDLIVYLYIYIYILKLTSYATIKV